MKKLKGKLNEMDYNLPDPNYLTSTPLPAAQVTQSTVCRERALASDID